jgi:hypothetical protein
MFWLFYWLLYYQDHVRRTISTHITTCTPLIVSSPLDADVRDLSLHAGVLCFLYFSYIWILRRRVNDGTGTVLTDVTDHTTNPPPPM